MTIKLNNHTKAYDEAKKAYAQVVKNESSTPEQVEAAWNTMQDELVNSLTTQITHAVQTQNADQTILATRGVNVLTSEETKFFNTVVQSDGFTDDIILPETTVDRIFEDLTTDHPFLSEINLQKAGLLTRIIKSEPSGAAVWGKVFGEIKGQLDAAFREESVTQSKLTAFVVLPKDLDKFGPAWIESYVRTQITETFAVALEDGFINGAGPVKDQPIGLIRDLEASVSQTTGHAKKAVAGTLTFADSQTTVKELSGLMKYLSTKSNDKSVNVGGKVVLVVNPTDAWEVKAQYTFLNANGTYVTALPFNLRIVESEFATAGEVIAFVNNRYDAYTAGGVQINKFDQTLALEDCYLYTAKQFAFGKAEDNKAAAIYTLSINTPEG
ncbi:phage major capsid protein [Peribacillus sp. JNUCC41]|uniref:phage major capsid protein n=1 Tax=Peribacillus sp. JNUCC41 TaxID=2778370 RepID=UPI00177B937B|nr:phage major capsid protein [Brevibacillus sp. JNUCC-41]QOS90225.1 phage major capsid protein [Brevibacillus sp. JNUCC-41]